MEAIDYKEESFILTVDMDGSMFLWKNIKGDLSLNQSGRWKSSDDWDMETVPEGFYEQRFGHIGKGEKVVLRTLVTTNARVDWSCDLNPNPEAEVVDTRLAGALATYFEPTFSIDFDPIYVRNLARVLNKMDSSTPEAIEQIARRALDFLSKMFDDGGDMEEYISTTQSQDIRRIVSVHVGKEKGGS